MDVTNAKPNEPFKRFALTHRNTHITQGHSLNIITSLLQEVKYVYSLLSDKLGTKHKPQSSPLKQKESRNL